MRRASSRPIASPRPKPPDDPAAVPRWKRSKMRSRSSAGCPAPWSATVIDARARRAMGLDAHRRPARAVAQRVVEQDPHDARDRVRVAAAPARPLGQDRRDRGRALARAQLELGRHRADDLAQLHRLRAQRHGGVQAREVEQLARERREPVELRARVVDLAQRVELVEPAASGCPPRAAPSCPGASSAACAARARRSTTNARRAPSWRRSSSCMRASARARSPTSSRRSSCGVGASGPSRVIRRAIGAQAGEPAQQRRGERDREQHGDEQADDGGDQEARAHLLDERRSLGQLAVGDEHRGRAVAVAEQRHARRSRSSPSRWISVVPSRADAQRDAASRARGSSENSLS